MSNVIKFAKKAFTLGVVSTTIMWSSMVTVFLPSVAMAAVCPALNPGDMIKVTGKAAIYAVNNENKVLYFPSGDEFKSWRENYGGYIAITQACFDSLMVPSTYPGAVNYRGGSYVVKRPSSDQLYVVEPNNALAKVTPEAAKALYGTGYKVMTVADAFWPHYVNRGADVTEGKPHPGMLVLNGGKTWYVDTDNKLREVTANGMSANMFMSKFVHVATDAMIAGMSFGDKIEAAVAALTDKTQSGGVKAGPGPTPGPVVSGNLMVSLAADNPFAATIVSDTNGGTVATSNGAQSMIPVMKLVFSAGADADQNVTMVKFKRGGISADTDISNMYLVGDDGKIWASNPSVSNNMVTFTKAAGLFMVSKGMSKNAWVKLDLKNNLSAGKTYMFTLADSASVAGTGSVGGSFPISSNTFTSASVTDLGKLAFTNVSPTAAGTVDPGTPNFELWRFTAASTNQDMEVRKMTFTLVGSVNPGDIKNFSLWDGAKQIGTTVVDMAADKTVMFDWAAAPYVVTKGQTRTLSLKADIVGGTNRTVYASIQNSGDIITWDKNYGVFVKTNGTDTFTTIQAGGATSVNWTINTGSLVQTLAVDSPTGNIADGGTNITLGKFLWKANGEDVKVTSLSVSSTSSGNTLNNVRLLVNGSQVGSTIASHTASNGADTNWGSFGSSFIIGAGKTAVVEVKADTTHSSVAADETILIALSVGSSNAQGTVSLTNISTIAQTGNTLTVKSGTVTVAKNAAFGNKTSGNPTATVNATGAKVGSFVITAGSGEDVNLSQITLRDDTITYCIGTYMQNLAIKDGSGKQLGVTYANPSSSCSTQNPYTFNLTPAVTITNGAQYVVDVFADMKATSTVNVVNLFDVNTVTASGVSTGTDASGSSLNTSLQDVFIAGSGAFMIQADSDTPIASNYLMGATDQTLGKFKVTASSTEAINITQLVVGGVFSSGATGTMMNVRLFDADTGLQVGTAAPSFSDSVAGTSGATSTYSFATFSGLNLQIPKGISKSLNVKVDFTTYEGSGLSTTGQTTALAIVRNFTGANAIVTVTATGASSGSSLTPTISAAGSVNVFNTANTANSIIGAYGATSTLYRTKLTTAWASDAPSGAASPSASQTVAKFVITNLANAGSYVATVNKVDFDLSTTISQAAGTGTSRAINVYKDSLSTTALETTNYFVGNGPRQVYDTNFTDASFTDVDIASGASKTFYVTMDTSDAASTKSLSVRIGSSDVTWSDGVSTSLTVMAQDLPLQYKTFTY